MSQFKIHTIESAPEAAQEALKSRKKCQWFYSKIKLVFLRMPLLHLNLSHGRRH